MQLIRARHAAALAAGALGLAGLVAGPAWGQSAKQVGVYRDWTVYTATANSGPICFAVSKPVEVVPSPDGYTQAYLYLTHRPSEQIGNEINLVAGFTFAADQQVTMSIDGQTFAMFSKDDAAWLDDPGKNDGVAGAMRAGTNVEVDGTTDSGIKVKETFSLAGATAASKALDGAC